MTEYAPNIHDLASKIGAVFPGLKDDVVFVLEKSLKGFTVANNEFEANLPEYYERRTAIESYSEVAYEAGELHDDGRYVWVPTLDETDSKWKWAPWIAEDGDAWPENLRFKPVATSAWDWETRENLDGSQRICSTEQYYGPGFTWNKPRNDEELAYYKKNGLVERVRHVKQLHATGARIDE